MDERDRRRELRGAVYRRDHAALIALLASEPWPPDALQLVGDGLVDALAAGVDAAGAPARRCSAELRERCWEGDDVLADALDAALGGTVHPGLRPLPVSLEDVATGLEGGEFSRGGRVDLATGEFWPSLDLGYSDVEEDEDDEREWLWVEGRGSHDGYRDMEEFIARIEDPRVSELLEVAIQGRGAFRRFKDTLSRWPEQLQAWYAFSEDRQLGRARAWLAGEGYTPTFA